jgi:hypothetical protein
MLHKAIVPCVAMPDQPALAEARDTRSLPITCARPNLPGRLLPSFRFVN